MSGGLVDGYVGPRPRGRLLPLTDRARRQARRLSRGPVVVTCTLCNFEASGPSWRPVKRTMDQHFADSHPKDRRGARP